MEPITVHQRRLGTPASNTDIKFIVALTGMLLLTITQKQNCFSVPQSIIMNKIDSCGPKADDGTSMCNIAALGLTQLQKLSAQHITALGEQAVKRKNKEYEQCWLKATETCPAEMDPTVYATNAVIEMIQDQIISTSKPDQTKVISQPSQVSEEVRV